MSSYTEFNAEFELIEKGGLFTSNSPLFWELGKKGSNLWIEVPASFPSDGPSIPKIFTLFFSRKNPKYQKAARLHDWLCDEDWTSSSAFSVFKDALKADKASFYERWVMSLCVLFYRSYRQRKNFSYK